MLIVLVVVGMNDHVFPNHLPFLSGNGDIYPGLFHRTRGHVWFVSRSARWRSHHNRRLRFSCNYHDRLLPMSRRSNHHWGFRFARRSDDHDGRLRPLRRIHHHNRRLRFARWSDYDDWWLRRSRRRSNHYDPWPFRFSRWSDDYDWRLWTSWRSDHHDGWGLGRPRRGHHNHTRIRWGRRRIITRVLMNDTPGGERQERGQGSKFKGDFHTFDPFHVPSSDTFQGDRCGCRE